VASRIVYTTNCADQTVIIDYNQTLRLFLTDKEQRPFSAERIIGMLNGWARINKVDITVLGRLHVVTDGAHCVLTQKARCTLSALYRQHPDWQIEYPFASDVLAHVAS
jgi:hypothetical protein